MKKNNNSNVKKVVKCNENKKDNDEMDNKMKKILRISLKSEGNL